MIASTPQRNERANVFGGTGLARSRRRRFSDVLRGHPLPPRYCHISHSTTAITATDPGTADARFRKLRASSTLQGLCPAIKIRKARTTDMRTAAIFWPRDDMVNVLRRRNVSRI